MSDQVREIDAPGLGKFVDWVWTLKEQRDALHAEAEALRAENARLQNALLEVTTRHFAESWKKRTSDADLEQYLAAGIAQLEAERDDLRAGAESLRAENAKLRTALAEQGERQEVGK